MSSFKNLLTISAVVLIIWSTAYSQSDKQKDLSRDYAEI
jgi:hypothetical protein